MEKKTNLAIKSLKSIKRVKRLIEYGDVGDFMREWESFTVGFRKKEYIVRF
jgi:hypothetical protein